MPQIEILPNTGAAPAPGWAYVPDTGYDPSKVAINPKDRKRIAARPGGVPSGNELSARQQTAIQRRLVELEKDNNSREAITIPGKGEPFPRTAGRPEKAGS
jgi:zinc finger HIT domain-containing protein 1